MASIKIPQLPAIPWPTLVGASLLLHAGVLSVGLPRMLQVNNPTANDSVDIPITLVDDGGIPIAPPPTNPTPPANNPAPPARAQSVTTSPKPLPKPASTAPMGGQNTAATPVEQATVQPQDPAAASPQKPVSSNPEETSRPTPQPETVNEPSREPIPVQQPPTDNPPAAEESGRIDAIDDPAGNSENSSPSPTQLIIVNDVQLPKNSGGDQIDQYPRPRFQMPITFDIPSNHACQGTLSTDVINLGLVIDAEGLVSSFRLLQPDIYAQNSDLHLADCLFSAAVADSSAIRFTPALRLTNIGEEEAVTTDRIQLRLRFSGG